MDRLDRRALVAERALATPALLLALHEAFDVVARSYDAGALVGRALEASQELGFFSRFHRDERASTAARRVGWIARAVSRADVPRFVRLAAWRAAFLAAEAANRFPALRPRPRVLSAEERADADLFNPSTDIAPISGVRAAE